MICIWLWVCWVVIDLVLLNELVWNVYGVLMVVWCMGDDLIIKYSIG